MNDHPMKNTGLGKKIFKSITVLILGSVAVVWAWNTLAADLLSLPRMQFKHGFAVMTALTTIFASWLITRYIFEQPPKQTK